MTSHRKQDGPRTTSQVKTGKQSAAIQELSPVGCKDCTIRNCPQRVREGDSICAFQERWVALGALLGDVYERPQLADFAAAMIKLQSFRFMKAYSQEEWDGMGLDPEVTKLGREVMQELRALAEIQGHIKSGTSVVVDQRQVHLHQEMRREIEQMPESAYADLLEAYANMREVNEKVTMQLMAGASLEDMIDEQVRHDRELEAARPGQQAERADRAQRARELRSTQED